MSAAVLSSVAVMLRLRFDLHLPLSQLDSCATGCHAEQSGIAIECVGMQPNPQHPVHWCAVELRAVELRAVEFMFDS